GNSKIYYFHNFTGLEYDKNTKFLRKSFKGGNIMKRRPSRHPPQKRRGVIFLIMLLAVILVFVLDAQIAPLVETSVKSQAQRLSVEGINQAVSEVLGDSQVDYQNVMQIEKDES